MKDLVVGGKYRVLNSNLSNPEWEDCEIDFIGVHKIIYSSESCTERVADNDSQIDFKEHSDCSIRRFIYWNRKKIKELLLSARQYQIIKDFKSKKITSRIVADKYNICVQNSSQQLINLYRKGYLTRSEKQDPTGGSIYEYVVDESIFDIYM